MIESPDDLAHHEAAHAAMCLMLDGRVVEVSIRPGYGHHGYVAKEIHNSPTRHNQGDHEHSGRPTRDW
jgi:hypothetical protein